MTTMLSVMFIDIGLDPKEFFAWWALFPMKFGSRIEEGRREEDESRRGQEFFGRKENVFLVESGRCSVDAGSRASGLIT